ADGTSRWVSGEAARIDTHRLRALCDTMLVGTGTVETDDPRLTVRDEQDRPQAVQPLRVVMGKRDLDPGRRMFHEPGESLHLRTRDALVALRDLFGRDRQHVFLEGGPTLAAAFLRAGLVDEIIAYVSPMLLGSGANAVADLGITTIADALRPRVTDITVLDDHDVRFTMTPLAVVEARAQRASKPPQEKES
ncbi:MAG: RibD family protein, partial [Nocardioides sp.]